MSSNLPILKRLYYARTQNQNLFQVSNKNNKNKTTIDGKYEQQKVHTLESIDQDPKPGQENDATPDAAVVEKSDNEEITYKEEVKAEKKSKFACCSRKKKPSKDTEKDEKDI